MTSNELKKRLRMAFPTLKKPFFGRDPITCRDAEFPPAPHGVYVRLDAAVWENIESLGIKYGHGFPDCDDFSDIKLGLFKIEWDEAIKRGEIKHGTPPRYAVCDGYNPRGENHDFNLFVSDMGIYISDYGEIKSIGGYRPMLARF